MKRFSYKAKDKFGKLVTGEVEASSPVHAARLVRRKGLIVISISSRVSSPITLIKRFRDRVSDTDIAAFTRQLSTMVNAGLPINEALLVLRSQSNPSMQKVVAQVLADIEAGESLSTALSRHPSVFNKTYVSLVKSGEVGGVMDEVLVRLADSLEKDMEFRGKVKGALVYPAIVVVGMIIVAFIMMIFVIPRLTSLYTEFNAEIPLATRILVSVSNFAIKFWPIFLFLVFLFLYFFRAYRNTKFGREKTDAFLLNLPIIGNLQQKVILTEFTRTLSLMVGAGVSILEALSVASEVVNNSVISSALKDTAKQIEKGFPVAYAFARHPNVFPFLLSQMIAVGEETGKMDEVLAKISHIYEVESNQMVKSLTATIEPVIMIILGLGVGFLVVAIILPIYNLTSQF